MVLLSREDVQGVHSVPDLLTQLRVPDNLWDGFVATAGDPGNDLRLVAAMPAWTIPQIVSSTTLTTGERLTPIQAAQVGLGWRNSRWIVHLHGGGNPDNFVDKDPWTPDPPAGPPEGTGAAMAAGGGLSSASGSTGNKENVLKMSKLVDQTDDSETKLPDAVMLNEWAREVHCGDGCTSSRRRRADRCSNGSTTSPCTCTETATVRGFLNMASLWAAGVEEPEVQGIHAGWRWLLRCEGVAWTPELATMVGQLACLQGSLHLPQFGHIGGPPPV